MTIDRPTMQSYMTRQSYEVWYYRDGSWHLSCTRASREEAIQRAENLGYPFWSVIRCKRDVQINTVED